MPAIPDIVPGRGLFAPPERFDRGPFSAADVARTVTDTAVEILQARGEPARYERLLGEILVGLDRAGQLRRLVAIRGGPTTADGDDGVERSSARPTGVDRPTSRDPTATGGRCRGGRPSRSAARPAGDAAPERTIGAARRPPGSSPPAEPGPRGRPSPADPVEAILALIRDELGRPTTGGSRGRARPLVAGRPATIGAAAMPLADRVEWAVFSLLSTAGRLSETASTADRRDVQRPRPARRGARPGLPPELPQPGQHARPDRDLGRPPAAQRRSTAS